MKNILLIEDDHFLIDIYTTKLKESGFAVEVVSDGELAFDKIKEKNPDLVILDIVLPHLDGWEILRQIKSDPKLKSIKIIILSNLAQIDEVEKGTELGAVRYLIKANYTPSEVIKEIKKLFEEK